MVCPVESDAGIQANQLLARSPVAELRTLHVECQADSLRISGSVCCFYHKQLAQETIRRVAQGLRLVNSVDVEPVNL